jgi:hypothetical protein
MTLRTASACGATTSSRYTPPPISTVTAGLPASSVAIRAVPPQRPPFQMTS